MRIDGILVTYCDQDSTWVELYSNAKVAEEHILGTVANRVFAVSKERSRIIQALDSRLGEIHIDSCDLSIEIEYGIYIITE